MEAIQIDVAKLDLQDGDVLWIRVPPTWQSSQYQNAHEAIERILRNAGIKAHVLFGTTDTELQIVRKAEMAAKLEGDDVG